MSVPFKLSHVLAAWDFPFVFRLLKIALILSHHSENPFAVHVRFCTQFLCSLREVRAHEVALSVSQDCLYFYISDLLCFFHVFGQWKPIQRGHDHRLKIHDILMCMIGKVTCIRKNGITFHFLCFHAFLHSHYSHYCLPQLCLSTWYKRKMQCLQLL